MSNVRGGAHVKPDSINHLISRFVAREFFVRSAGERQAYLYLLGRDLKRSDWRCFSFAIMSNHIHLGLLAGQAPLVDWLRDMHTDFALWINERSERIGGVFVRGPKMIEFQPQGVPELINYIHNNPVRAGVVDDARDSDWTSHRAYCGLTRVPSWLDVQLGLELSGFADGASLDRWMREVRTKRAELDAFRVEPVRRGRPRKVAGEPPPPVLRVVLSHEERELHETFMCDDDAGWYYDAA